MGVSIYLYATSLQHHRRSVEWLTHCRETVTHSSINWAGAALPAPCVSLSVDNDLSSISLSHSKLPTKVERFQSESVTSVTLQVWDPGSTVP